MNQPRVGLDSQCYSYLIDALDGLNEPTGLLAQEQIALVRCFLHAPRKFVLVETVVAECAKIRNTGRRNQHDSWRHIHFVDQPIQNRAQVDLRAEGLHRFHPKINDCRVLAESEGLGLSALLSYDRDFRQRLAQRTMGIELITPSAYWARLGVARGATPQRIPHETNPLSQQTWWHW
jgi:hypothetical protein